MNYTERPSCNRRGALEEPKSLLLRLPGDLAAEWEALVPSGGRSEAARRALAFQLAAWQAGAELVIGPLRFPLCAGFHAGRLRLLTPAGSEVTPERLEALPGASIQAEEPGDLARRLGPEWAGLLQPYPVP